jgi:hypothetical protein
MGAAPAMGVAMTRAAVAVLLGGALAAVLPGPAAGADRYALIVSGASGSPQHAATNEKRRDALLEALTGSLGVPAANVIVLRDTPAASADSATRAAVTQAVKKIGTRLKPDDVFLIVLLGHGSDDGVDAKFNLVGPDMSADEWRTLLQPLAGRLVFVNTTAASAAFLERLAGPNRIVITATNSPAQQYDTVFADFFAPAFTVPDADLDKDGRVSVGEAFAFASERVKRHYAERGQLVTERAVLDDTGDGKGKEAGTPGPDGSVASRTFFDVGPEQAATGDTALSELLARRNALETSLEELKRKKEFMPPDDYARELERLLLEHARLSREIRGRS